MTPRERFIAALERRPITGRVPHFELVFFLTMEAFGRVHPSHRNYAHRAVITPGGGIYCFSQNLIIFLAQSSVLDTQS